MAVTKIRKISSWTLTASLIISVIVVLAFFFGGTEQVMLGKEHSSYKFTNLLLNWTYVIFALTVIVGLGFAIGGFFKSFKHNKQKALMSLGSFILLAAVLLITYLVGATEPLQLNADSARYNTPEMLKLTDMWILTIYILFALAILSIVWGAIRRNVLKK